MQPARGYMLDTNIVLHWTRDKSPVAAAIDQQFGLASSAFRPLICEVTLGEMLSFARSSKWGDKRLAQWRHVERQLVVIPISDHAIHEAYAELHTVARQNKWGIQHDHNDLWIAATNKVAGTRLLTTDSKGFLPLRNGVLDVVVLDAHTGVALP